MHANKKYTDDRPPTDHPYLRQCENAAETIEETLKRSKAFRDWKRDSSG